MKRSRNIGYENPIYKKIFISDQIMANYMINLSLYNNKSKRPKLVPFPQKPKISGVVIEEIKTDNLDEMEDEIEFHQIKFESNGLIMGEILPKPILRNILQPDLSNAVVLWKPLSFYTEYVDNELSPNIDKTHMKKYCDDVEMEEVKSYI